MKSRIVILLIISLLAALITYISLSNIFIAAGVLVIYLITSLLIFEPMMKKHNEKVTRFHECYHFLNNFIISLSIKKSIKGALESTVGSMPNQFIEMFESLENMSDDGKLDYLSTYFYFHVYQLFLQIVKLWEEEGGDILQMSKYLISEIRNNEEYITKSDSLWKSKNVEIAILWAFCAFIVVVLRFSLKDFYASIQTQTIFIASIIVLMLFILFSIFLLLQRGMHLKIKGSETNEKNA